MSRRGPHDESLRRKPHAEIRSFNGDLEKGLSFAECDSALCLALECFQGVIFERRDTPARPVCRDGAMNKELARKTFARRVDLSRL